MVYLHLQLCRAKCDAGYNTVADYFETLAVADPGFPRGGGANLKGGGANLLFGHFFLKTAWKWRNFGPEGGVRPSRPPLDPPLFGAIEQLNKS